MFGTRRRRNRSRAAYRAPFWAAIAIIVLIAFLDDHPWVLDAEESTAEGKTPTTEGNAGVVVVLDYSAIAQSSGDFQQRDWSAAWLNVVEQELGAATVATPSTLTTDMIESAHALILTASVSEGLPESLRQRLRDHVLDGMTLVLEKPGGALRESYAANGEAGRERGYEVTLVRGLSEPYASQLEQLPVHADYIGSTAPKQRATTLLAFDGAPVVYSVPIGDGHVITIEFDVGEQLVALQQGIPDDNFRIQPPAPERTPTTQNLSMDALASQTGDRESSDGDAGAPPTADAGISADATTGGRGRRTADETPSVGRDAPDTNPDRSAVSREIPYADLLERFLVWNVLTRTAPVVGFWPYPAGKQGAMLLLHSDAELGDRADWMLEYEVRRGATSTLLTTVDSGLSASGAAVIDRRGGQVGLMWRPSHTRSRSLHRIGLLGVTPLAAPRTLSSQLAGLRETLPPGDSITTVRTFNALWSTRWAGPFHTMEAAKLTYDASYRPGAPGFSWGTGMPFRPLSRRGLPFSVREIPVIFPDSTGASLDLGPILLRSEQGHHQTLTVDIPPASFSANPSIVRFERWLEMFDDAERFDHWITDPSEYHAFSRARRDSTIRSTYRSVPRIPKTAAEQLESARREVRAERDLPTAAVSDDESGEGTRIMRLRIDATAEREDLSLVVPSSIGEATFQQTRRRVTGGTGAAARQLGTEEATLSGGGVRIVPLDTGANAVDVYYSAPGTSQ